jgi:hypothetical protein
VFGKATYHNDRVSLNEIPNGQNCQFINAELCSFCFSKSCKGKEKVSQIINPVLKKIRPTITYGSNPVLLSLPEQEPVNAYNLLKENAADIREKKLRVWTISSFIIKFFPLEGPLDCLICNLHNNTREEHNIDECPIVKQRCIRCLEE